MLLGCMGRGIDRLRINPGTGHQQSPGEIQTRDWRSDLGLDKSPEKCMAKILLAFRRYENWRIWFAM
jgi:hypothetical protein